MDSFLRKRLKTPVQTGFLQKIKADILSFPPFTPPVVSKDIQRNETIVKSAAHLHVQWHAPDCVIAPVSYAK